MKIQLSTKEGLFVQFLRGNISPINFRLLSQWLDCYSYITPTDRFYPVYSTADELTRYIWSVRDREVAAFIFWEACTYLNDSYTQSEQQRITEWVKENTISEIIKTNLNI